jgi:hypothetical protein
MIGHTVSMIRSIVNHYRTREKSAAGIERFRLSGGRTGISLNCQKRISGGIFLEGSSVRAYNDHAS